MIRMFTVDSMGIWFVAVLSQSHKSEFAFEGKKNSNVSFQTSSSLVFFFIIVLLKYISHDYWLFWHLQVKYSCTLDSVRRTRCIYVVVFECFFHYVPMINSIPIWIRSTCVSKLKHTHVNSNVFWSSQHSTFTC